MRAHRAGTASETGEAIAGLALFDGAAGQAAASCVHAVASPLVSMSNETRLVLPSGIKAPSPICRRGTASIAFIGSRAIVSLQTSNFPMRAGYLPKATAFSEPAITITVLVPAGLWP